MVNGPKLGLASIKLSRKLLIAHTLNIYLRNALLRMIPWMQAECVAFVRTWSEPRPGDSSRTTSSHSFLRALRSSEAHSNNANRDVTRSHTSQAWFARGTELSA